MSCENLEVPAPLIAPCVSTLFGVPYQQSGRTVAGTVYPIAGIILHCESDNVASLCNEVRCRTKSSVISGTTHSSYHYMIGSPASSGPILQSVNDSDISWTFNTYKSSNYPAPPPSATPINWPTLQGLYGLNVSPDLYVLNIGLAIGKIIEATQAGGCWNCETSSGLTQPKHDELVQLLAYLAQQYDIPIDSEHINWHDNISCTEIEECLCADIETLLAEVQAYCPPCQGDEAPIAPIAESDDVIQYIMGITEPCCPSSSGCYTRIPWTECFIGDLAVDGDLENYLLGLSQDPATGAWCLTRGCLATLDPLVGCGTVSDPLRIDLCSWGSYIPDQAADTFVNLVGLDAAGCLIEGDAGDIVAFFETPITPVDTATVDLTVSGVSDHTLQADVIVSPDALNQIEIRGNGLYANYDCQDFLDDYEAGIISIIVGQDTLGNCVHQTAEDLVNNAICVLPEVVGLPEFLLGKTDSECPVFVTPASIIEAGLVVNDTSTIDLTLAGNVLTADAIISPDANNILVDSNGLYVPDITVSDGFCVHMNYDPVTRNINSELIVAPHLPDNIFQCIPGAPGSSGAYVQDLSVVDTDCIDVTYVGRQLTVSVIVDPVVDNILECNANGLYVPLGGGITAADTNCLDLTLVGGVLTGVITLAPTQGLIPNALSCLPGGLYVPQGGGLAVTDTSCIDLDLTNGNLTATLIVNPSGDNQFSCGMGGAYVPIAAGLIANDTSCVNHSLVGGVLSTTLNIAGPQGGIPNVISCITGQGLYAPESHINVVDTTCIDLTFAGGVLSADIIIDPTGDNQVQCLPAGLYVPPAAGLIATDTDCITLNLAGDVLTSTPILAPTQGGVPNALECIAGQGLYVPEAAGLEVLDTDCIDLTLTAGGVLSADPIISPDDCNGLVCLGNGLYVNNDIQSVSVVDPENQQTQIATGPLTNANGRFNVGRAFTVNLTNPSDCNDMSLELAINGVGLTVVNQFGTNNAIVSGGYTISVNGGPQQQQTFTSTEATAPLNVAISLAGQSFSNVNQILAPGASYTLVVQPYIEVQNGTFNGTATARGANIQLRGISLIDVDVASP